MKAFLIAAVMVTPLVALAHGNEKAVDAANYTPAQLVGKLKAKDRMHTDLASIAVAKCVCRASDWHSASRVPGPGADLRRSAPATNSFFLCCVLQ